MKSINDLKIGTRLNLVFNLAFIVIVGLLGLYTIRSQRNQIIKDTDTRMNEQVNDLATIITDQISQRQKSTENSLRICENEILGSGRFTSGNQMISIEAKNQETNEVSQVQLKKVDINGMGLYNNERTLDKVTELTGSVASILQRIPQGYVRIATTIKQKDGTRAINTYIPNDSPVAKALDNGEVYYGRAIVLGEWYLTAYKPYKLSDGTVVVLFTGNIEKDMASLKGYFNEKKYFNTGYPFLVDKSGTLVIHPTKEGSEEKDAEFFRQMIAHDDGIGSSEYIWEGRKKIQYFKYIPEIESYVAVSIFQDEFLKIVRQVTYAILIAVLAGIGVFILITIYLSRSITNALKKGVEFAKYIAKGDLTVNLNVNQKDEIGELAGALSQMLAKLKEIVINIRVGADSIAAASSQISNGSQQLSQGATEQASSTEEISSSMEEMVSNIQQNTDNAKQTEQISGKAKDSMLEMSTIGRESFDSIKTIAEKITIINDIAFQTNLLALNAAVEAARAGEHGRGFAVVAAEVRKLAERSKLAADEIGNLSKNSLKITEKTRESLDALVPEIQKTSQLVQEITAASIEQNSGADQINSAIQQLNVVTQQNAASSEEMATSAEELSSQAESLKEAVSYFKVEEEFMTSSRVFKANGRSDKSGDKLMTGHMKKTIHMSQPASKRSLLTTETDFENF